MQKFLTAYFTIAVVFLGLDLIWIGVVMKDFYRSQIGALMLETPDLPVAIAFYLIYVAGIVIFSVLPAGSWKKAAILGAMFGFFTYATYDLTNLATLKGWTTTVALADMGWGAFSTCVAACLGYAAASRFAK